MKASVVREYPRRLPETDDHPYRTGAWRPQHREWDAWDLTVLEGEIPRDLNGIYLRNTENPLLPAIGRYHPFDGDGMLHAITFEDGRASYRNRMIDTEGLRAELAADAPLWAGILEAPEKSARDGWGARTRMKDASSTDVVVHRGMALTTFYQCGDVYQSDPRTLEQLGAERWSRSFPTGISAHPKLDENTGELLVFGYGKTAPFMHYGIVSAEGVLDHQIPIELPGPRLPHDMAFTERFAILNDFPLFWDPALLARNVHRAKLHPGVPSRFAIVPRRGRADEVRWFEASPTYVLHWINAFEDGDTVVLDGYFQEQPVPEHRPDDGPWSLLHRSISIRDMRARPHRWRFDLATGACTEEPLDDEPSEFPMVHGRRAGRRHRYFTAMRNAPGWFLFDELLRYDLATMGKQRWKFPPGVFASESPIAPKTGAASEEDAYVVTFVSDVQNDRSECQIFDLRDVSRGPIARVLLPERIASGTHACWVPLGDLPGRSLA
jgi:carotenoid cleavage dioxygenase-like enzyme